MVKIAVSGCVHGELEVMYDTVRHIEEQEGIKVDLLLCCGDFESTRNVADLLCMAVPPKYRTMNSFYKYYTGERQAPVLTVFIGGNHEASNYLQELPYGGWVAPNIYFLGTCGCITFRGLRIAGLSGIFKQHDYAKPHFECVPYTNDTMRSLYHTRAIDVFRVSLLANSPLDEAPSSVKPDEVKQSDNADGNADKLKAASGESAGSASSRYRKRVDIVLSHDWPTNVYQHGDWQGLLRRKPFFRDEVQSGQLGSPPLESLLRVLKPRYWFSAHLHCAFAALVDHTNGDDANKSDARIVTRFLALDKALPRRHFIQIVDIEPEGGACDSDVDLEQQEAECDEPDAKVRKCASTETPATSEDAPQDAVAEAPTSDSTSCKPVRRHRLRLDPVFLAILRKTDSLSSVYDFDPNSARFAPTVSDVRAIEADFDHCFDVPDNFAMTAPGSVQQRDAYSVAAQVVVNPQTTLLCTMLDIRHPNAEIAHQRGGQAQQGQANVEAIGRAEATLGDDKVSNPDEIRLSDDDDDAQ